MYIYARIYIYIYVIKANSDIVTFDHALSCMMLEARGEKRLFSCAFTKWKENCMSWATGRS